MYVLITSMTCIEACVYELTYHDQGYHKYYKYINTDDIIADVSTQLKQLKCEDLLRHNGWDPKSLIGMIWLSPSTLIYTTMT